MSSDEDKKCGICGSTSTYRFLHIAGHVEQQCNNCGARRKASLDWGLWVKEPKDGWYKK